MTKCYIGLGSNMGDSETLLATALEMTRQVDGIELAAVAPLYRTAPQGFVEQNDFINTVAKIHTRLEPLELLNKLQHIENRLGRVRTVRWGPRTLDLDILLYGDRKIDLPELQVPHPRMHQRAFVMIPLADLNPELLIAGERAADLALRLSRQQRVEKLNGRVLPGFCQDR